MGWLIASIVIVVFVASSVTGVLHPALYGLFIAGVFVIPLWVISSLCNGVIDSIFGKRR